MEIQRAESPRAVPVMLMDGPWFLDVRAQGRFDGGNLERNEGLRRVRRGLDLKLRSWLCRAWLDDDQSANAADLRLRLVADLTRQQDSRCLFPLNIAIPC